MDIYDRPATSPSSQQTETLEALLKILDAFESLAQTLRHGETYHSHVLDLLGKAERRTSSLRGTLIELNSFYRSQL
jgi:hypothetical protein